jgi:predicted glycoside hydrolase/deacetylase ChbG (UPF0249 family)
MATGHALSDAAERAQELPDLGVGLHLTLVGERPVCRPEEIPSLVGRNGLLLPGYRDFLVRYLQGAIRARDVRLELRAQAAALAERGLRLDHLNSHQHLHLLPGLLGLTLEVAREHGIQWIRAPRPLTAPGSADTPPRPPAERLMFALASGWARRRIARAGLPLAQGSLGFDCSGHLNAGYLLRHIAVLPPGVTELICHPGEEGAETQRCYTSWGYCWQQEVEALTSTAVRRALELGGVQSGSFGAIGSGAAACCDS